MRKRLFGRTIMGLCCGVLLSVTGGSARADSLTINLGTQFSGETPVGGTAPWMTAAFESNTAGTVDLTITNNLSYSSTGVQEFISQFVFNTTVSKLSDLTITQTSSSFTTPASAPIASSIKTGSNSTGSSIKANAGSFDVALNWSTANGPNRFNGGGTAVYFQLTDATDKITAASFDATSTGSPGGYYAAAKVQGVPLNGGTTSVTIAAAAVPEPSSGILALIGLAGASSLAWFRRRKSS